MIYVVFFTFSQILLISTVFGVPRPVPHSPCPNVFMYEKMELNDGWAFPSDHNLRWRGMVFIPSSPLPIFLKVKLSVPAALPTNYVGKLELAENKDTVLDRIYSGSKEKIKYYLYFPKTQLPKVQLIEVNSKILCSSGPAHSRVKTTLTLEHSLLPLPPNIFGRIGNLEKTNFLEDNSDSKVLEFSGESCGKTAFKNSSADASVAVKGNWPWTVPLYKRTELGLQFFCSATLITRELVVTAAHCVNIKSSDPIDKADIIAYVGRFNIRNWTEEHTQPREIEKVFIHPDYNSETLYSDLAVLKFKQKIEITPYANPVCLWSGDEVLNTVVGRQGVVFGWGMDGLGNKVTATPKLANMPIVSQEECLRSKIDFVFLTSNRTFCAGLRNGTGPCNGDSGGGLLLRQKRNDGTIRWYLRGVVSLSLLESEKQMCNVHEFTVFTDVAKFRDWILGLIL